MNDKTHVHFILMALKTDFIKVANYKISDRFVEIVHKEQSFLQLTSLNSD